MSEANSNSNINNRAIAVNTDATNEGVTAPLRGPYFKKVLSEGRAVCLSAQRELGASWRERFFEIRYP